MKHIRGLLASFLLVGLAACGSDRLERGLAPASEEAVPDSVAEDEESDAERRQQLEQEIEKRQQQEMNQDQQQEQRETEAE
jgi:hypothetical protein